MNPTVRLDPPGRPTGTGIGTAVAPPRVRNTKHSYLATKLAYNIGRLHGLRLRLYLYRRIGMKIGKGCVIRRGVYLGSPNELELGDGSFVGRASLVLHRRGQDREETSTSQTGP